MSFTFKCPKCGSALEAQDEWDGLSTQCPTCQETIKIEKTSTVQVTSPVLKAAAKNAAASNDKFPFVCPSCGTFAELNVGLLGKPYTCSACCETVTAVEAKEKECPFCGEKIKFNAQVCRYCQRSLGNRTPMRNNSPGYAANNYGPNAGNGMQKSHTAYILLGIFLGSFGAHNFYAGENTKGFIKLALTLLVFVLGAFASFVWAIIEICTVKTDASGTPFI